MQEKNKKLLQKSKAPYFYGALYEVQNTSCQAWHRKLTAFLQLLGLSVWQVSNFLALPFPIGLTIRGLYPIFCKWRSGLCPFVCT